MAFSARSLIGAALLVSAGGGIAQAGIGETGTNFPEPVVSGTTNQYFIGNGAAGTLTINGGITFTAGTLTAGNLGTGNGTITVDGIGTTVTLNPVGNVNVIQPGNWGIGSLTVSGGAVFDATNVASCSGGAIPSSRMAQARSVLSR